MEITAIEAHPLRDDLWNPWCVITVETDVGLRGVGEAGGLWANTDLDAKVTHVEKVAEWFRGHDPRRIEHLRVEAQETPWGLSRLNQALLSGVEMACWDIVGKHHDVPVHEALGGKVRDELRVYANGWYDSLETPEEWAAGAEAVVDRGYTAMKFDPFETAHRDISNEALELAIDRIDAMREAIGPGPDLIVEAHERFTPAEAIKVGRRLEPYNPLWFEAPVQAHQGPAAFREVKEALAVPITDDLASIQHKFDAFEYIAARAIDGIQPDTGNVGGLRETQYIAQMADAASIFTAPHAAAGPISLTACIHVDAVIPNFKIQEGFEASTRPDWVADVIETPLAVEDGTIAVPDEPGLGVSFDADEAATHDRNPMPDHNYLEPDFKDTYQAHER